MPLWSSTDANTGSPKFAPNLINLAPTQANCNLMYGNVTTSAFITGAGVGIFGVDTTEMANTSANSVASHPAHSGWVLRKAGTGNRANRVQTEVLIAMGSMTGDGSISANDNLIYANT